MRALATVEALSRAQPPLSLRRSKSRPTHLHGLLSPSVRMRGLRERGGGGGVPPEWRGDGLAAGRWLWRSVGPFRTALPKAVVHADAEGNEWVEGRGFLSIHQLVF